MLIAALSLDFKLNSAEATSKEAAAIRLSAAIRLTAWLQEDWPALHFTLRPDNEQHVSQKQVFADGERQYKPMCSIAFSISGPLMEQTLFLYFHSQEGRQFACHDIIVQKEFTIGAPTMHFVHSTMKEVTAAEYAVQASIQIMGKAADKYEVAAAEILQQTLQDLFGPDWTETADISSTAASALAGVVEHEGFQRIRGSKDHSASNLLRDPVARKVLQDMSAVAYGTDEYYVI